jgi:hypothetical protein
VDREVIFAPEALGDLRALYDVIALDAGTGLAQSTPTASSRIASVW